jgi:hypothetical protein
LKPTAYALPALAVPAVANAAPALAVADSSTTLPPDLIERFVYLRAWYLDNHRRYSAWSDEFDGRFYAATGVTTDQYRDLDHNDPVEKELRAVFEKTFKEVHSKEDDTECKRLGDERWEVAEAIMEHQPQTIADLAWQAEAFLIADLEILHEQPNEYASDRLIRTLFRHIRTLGGVPQRDDPLGALAINIEPVPDCEDVETDESVTESEAAAAVAATVAEPSSMTGGQVYDRYVALDQSNRDCVAKLITYLLS